MKSWVAKHTGLPSFYSPQPVRVVCEDGRVLDRGEGAHTLVSDALARPGVPTRYSVGGETVILNRTDKGHELVSVASGASVPVVWLGDDGVSVDLGIHSTQARRWSIVPPQERGVLKLRTKNAHDSQSLSQLLNARTLLIAVHSPQACTTTECDISSVRVVTVTDYENARTSRVDASVREWSLSYERAPRVSFSGAVPVLTWGSVAQDNPNWHSGTIESFLQQVTGMP